MTTRSLLHASVELYPMDRISTRRRPAPNARHPNQWSAWTRRLTPHLRRGRYQEADIREQDAPPTELRSTTQHSRSTLRPRSTADEVRSLILESLAKFLIFQGAALRSLSTGFRPWNAMLNFAPRSTSHSEALVFREALADIVRELRARVRVSTSKATDPGEHQLEWRRIVSYETGAAPEPCCHADNRASGRCPSPATGELLTGLDRRGFDAPRS